MLRVGAHVSISGGVEKAVSREEDLGGNTGQIFVGSPRGWKVNEIDPSEAEEFKQATREADVGPWIVHGTYLINFATPKDDLATKSINTVQAELEACAELGIEFYTFHPGSHTGAGVDTGLQNIADRISALDIPDETTLLLENTAGKGTSLGKSFDQLATMVDQSTYGWDSVGVCLDSCHLYAAGYDFCDREKIEEMIAEFHEAIGIENLQYLHLNDSKHPLGSEKDEHEHIGDGEIGEDGFSNLINHEQTRDLPMVLETPEDDKGYEWNLSKIKELHLE